MAQKSFLSTEQWEKASEVLMPPLMTPDGDVRQVFCFSSDNFSSWLGTRLEERFKSFSDWESCHPIILGSWARGELSPKSDIDVLFCGDEKKVKAFVDFLQEQGLKLRYRMPQNPDDWTENVEAFDILALLKGKPWTSYGAQKLFEQQKKIWSKKKYYRRILLKALKEERNQRAKRYDSITNYLEPNIKYGPGGMRDLEQGLQVYELFAEKFTNPGHALNVLKYYRDYFLSLRQKLHLEGLGDILSSTSQFDLAKWMGFKTHKDFMRDLQRGLSRVHFYSDWIVAVAESSEKELKDVDSEEFAKIEDVVFVLHKNSSVLIQKKVRENLDELLPEEKLPSMAKRRGQILAEILNVQASDDFLRSVFRSRLIDKLVPEMRRLVGYVQHDQYHRFTADSHILQACREAKRVFRKPAELGPLKNVHKDFSDEDWRILSWTCLYHDLAKGLEHGEDHSKFGVAIVEKDFKAFHHSKQFTQEVAWMVENHLELSKAAFRKNPRDPKVWQELRDKGVEGIRLRRLALFTAIDIRATNPEAWNDWKAKLLSELVANLESKKAQNYFELHALRMQKKLKVPLETLEALGPVLLESIPAKELVQDLKKIESSTTPLKPWVYKNRKGEIWVRFYDKTDRTGLLSEYVGQLYSLGLGVRHASIQTLPSVGVYDWFQVTSTKTVQQLSRLFENAQFIPKPVPQVKFDEISLVSADEREWVISFKGTDQNGLLASAAKALSDLNCSVKSASVHTWGRQIDDVFTVGAGEDIQKLMADLKELYGL